MRLLKLNEAGSFSLSWFPKNKIPPYAILSHTWGTGQDEEVTFKDLTDGTSQNKPGFQKLQFCCTQAKADNLDYFWVDTCCIDKSSSSELQTAINFMFRWYQRAAKCYVFLSDVTRYEHDGQSHIEWETAFIDSRWFTRGWTLQELLAPEIVEFYSRDRFLLGDKKSLEPQIHEITGIASEAILQEDSISNFSIEDRLKWAEKRETTEEEDGVYCLLGIFDIQMPLLYGEGKEKAMHRLRREIKEFSQNPLESLSK
jgi:hypothetical protein